MLSGPSLWDSQGLPPAPAFAQEMSATTVYSEKVEQPMKCLGLEEGLLRLYKYAAGLIRLELVVDLCFLNLVRWMLWLAMRTQGHHERSHRAGMEALAIYTRTGNT